MPNSCEIAPIHVLYPGDITEVMHCVSSFHHDVSYSYFFHE